LRGKYFMIHQYNIYLVSAFHINQALRGKYFMIHQCNNYFESDFHIRQALRGQVLYDTSV